MTQDSNLTDYVVDVKTSDKFRAGTDANVYIQLFGQIEGESVASEQFLLKNSQNFNKFERNSLDHFIFKRRPCVGPLKTIRVWHDNAGVGPSWHLEYIEISDIEAGLKYRFPCHRWFSTTEEDRQISRELRCTEVSVGPKRAIQTAAGVLKGRDSSSASLPGQMQGRSDSLVAESSQPSSRRTSLSPQRTLAIYEEFVSKNDSNELITSTHQEHKRASIHHYTLQPEPVVRQNSPNFFSIEPKRNDVHVYSANPRASESLSVRASKLKSKDVLPSGINKRDEESTSQGVISKTKQKSSAITLEENRDENLRSSSQQGSVSVYGPHAFATGNSKAVRHSNSSSSESIYGSYSAR